MFVVNNFNLSNIYILHINNTTNTRIVSLRTNPILKKLYWNIAQYENASVKNIINAPLK